MVPRACTASRVGDAGFGVGSESSSIPSLAHAAECGRSVPLGAAAARGATPAAAGGRGVPPPAHTPLARGGQGGCLWAVGVGG